MLWRTRVKLLAPRTLNHSSPWRYPGLDILSIHSMLATPMRRFHQDRGIRHEAERLHCTAHSMSRKRSVQRRT